MTDLELLLYVALPDSFKGQLQVVFLHGLPPDPGVVEYLFSIKSLLRVHGEQVFDQVFG